MSDFKQTSHSSRARYLAHFDKWTVAKGEDLWRRRLVLDWQLESARRLSGVVGTIGNSSSGSYSCKVFLDERTAEIRRTECNCSRGAGCEHAVAVLMTYLDTTPARVASSLSGAVVKRTAATGTTPPPFIPDLSERIIIEPDPVNLNVRDLTFEVYQSARPGEQWWFSLAISIDVNGQKIQLLPILLKAIRERSIDQLDRSGKFIFSLADGTKCSLPFERVKSMLLSVEEMIRRDSQEKIFELSILHAAQIMTDEHILEARWQGAERVLALVQNLKKLGKIEIVEPPANFGTTLRDYQKEGLSWLQFLARHNLGGILADDMGLGKTVQLLAHVCLQREQHPDQKFIKPILVVCPTSVLPNWLSESEKFAPFLKVISFHGSERSDSVSQFEGADMVITTYPILTRDLKILTQFNWHGVCLDEAQSIKNPTTQMAQAARSLKADYRFCLTGTPVENHLGELWSQFEFLMPGILGDANKFKLKFRNPIEKENDGDRKIALARRIKPFLLRRTKKEVAKELPDKTIIIQKIELNSAQKDLYETVRLASTKQVRDEIAARGFKNSQIMILDALLKLRQVCCHPRLVKLTDASKIRQSAKLDELLNKLEQLIDEGHKILVFSQFTSMLALIAEQLATRKIQFVSITGDTKDRKTPVDEFQKGSVPVFLISLKAGGTGLNLTAADVVIHYDPWWNPAVEEQATDRAHRIGQKKKVFVYKLIAKGTIEQKMVELQERKRELAGTIYDEEGNLSLAFSEDDMDYLLAPIDGL